MSLIKYDLGWHLGPTEESSVLGRTVQSPLLAAGPGTMYLVQHGIDHGPLGQKVRKDDNTGVPTFHFWQDHYIDLQDLEWLLHWNWMER